MKFDEIRLKTSKPNSNQFQLTKESTSLMPIDGDLAASWLVPAVYVLHEAAEEGILLLLEPIVERVLAPRVVEVVLLVTVARVLVPRFPWSA